MMVCHSMPLRGAMNIVSDSEHIKRQVTVYSHLLPNEILYESQAWWCMPITTALERNKSLRSVHTKFQVSIDETHSDRP